MSLIRERVAEENKSVESKTELNDFLELSCPITLQNIRHPVITIDAKHNAALFELDAIYKHVVAYKKIRSPTTGEEIICAGYANFLLPSLEKLSNRYEDYEKDLKFAALKNVIKKNNPILHFRRMAIAGHRINIQNRNHSEFKKIFFPLSIVLAFIGSIGNPPHREEDFPRFAIHFSILVGLIFSLFLLMNCARYSPRFFFRNNIFEEEKNIPINNVRNNL